MTSVEGLKPTQAKLYEFIINYFYLFFLNINVQIIHIY